MSGIKIKGNTKFKMHGKCDLLRKRLCDEVLVSNETKIDYRDYMNEIFAGFIWLG